MPCSLFVKNDVKQHYIGFSWWKMCARKEKLEIKHRDFYDLYEYVWEIQITTVDYGKVKNVDISKI